MAGSRLIRLTAAALVGASGAVVVISLLSGITDGAARGTMAGSIAVLSAAVTVAIGSVLLDSRRVDDPAAARAVERTVSCTACGGQVQRDWRLCPHCGAMRTTDERLTAARSRNG